MIVLDYRDRRPLYEQVTEKLEELMFSGVLPPDSRLPSVRSMATELSINPNTIQRAYAELERQGYIYSIQGKGSFVSDGRYLAEGIRKDWKKQFDAAIEEGLRIGVSYQDMIKILEEREGGKTDA
jgi:DNA-binding transcriptional regulator YhcF (GntR family)